MWVTRQRNHLRVLVQDDAEDGTARDVGHDHPQLLLVHEGAVQRHDIGMPHLRHDLRLPPDCVLQRYNTVSQTADTVTGISRSRGTASCPNELWLETWVRIRAAIICQNAYQIHSHVVQLQYLQSYLLSQGLAHRRPHLQIKTSDEEGSW